MNFLNTIGKYYTINKTTQPVNSLNPIILQSNNSAFSKVKPNGPVKFYQPDILDLNKIIKNEQLKIQKKNLVDFLEKNSPNKKTHELKWENIIGAGIVGLSLWAIYTYSGYKITFIPPQNKN
jgi:hypothetical protein